MPFTRKYAFLCFLDENMQKHKTICQKHKIQVLLMTMEFARSILLVGKKNKSDAERWVTSFTVMLLILMSVYLQRLKIDFPRNVDTVLRHEQENVTFSSA